jgi:hypothetical protein
MGLSGAIGDAWEILANVVESVAILVRASESAADPGWHVGSGARYWWCCWTSGAVLVVLLLRDERGSVLVVLLLCHLW